MFDFISDINITARQKETPGKVGVAFLCDLFWSERFGKLLLITTQLFCVIKLSLMLNDPKIDTIAMKKKCTLFYSLNALKVQQHPTHVVVQI